jgi:TolB-like protein/Flp pilus assembly protein TadD
LGVKYVLEGSIQKAGDQLRVNAQLIDALKGHHLWAERYDRNLKDLFALQDEITMKVLTAMEVKLTRGESARFYRTDSFEAWSYVVKGSRLFDRLTMEDNAKARMLFDRALRIDPDYAAALSFLSWTHFIEVRFGWSEAPAESMKIAFEIGQKSLALDETQPDVHSLFNTIYMVQRQYDKAIAEGKRAIELGPNDAQAHALLGQTMRYAGRFEEAASLSEKALRLQPYYPSWYLTNLAICYYYVGKYEEAIDIIKQYLQLAENLRENESPGLHQALAMNYVRLDRLEDARNHAAKVLRLLPGFSLEYDRKASFYSNPAHLEQQHEDLRMAGIPEHPPLKLPDKPSIAVLPFNNLSKDPEQEYFSDGLTDEIITTLSKSPRLFVIARESVFTYKTKQVPVNKVSRELGVRYVLEGSVRKSEDRLRVTVQLIDATTGHPLWSERFEKPLGEIFAIQDEITLSILRALQVKLSEGEQARLIGKKTNNLDAYLKAIQAQEQFFQMNRQGSMRAKELANESIGLDPNYAFPYTTIANAHMLDAWFNFSTSPGESMKLATDAAEKALIIDDSDPAIYSTLTNLYVMQGQYDRAINSARQAIELSPGGARAHISMGYALYFSCRFEEAIPFMEQAIRLNPYPPGLYYRSLASVYRFAGRHDESLAAYKKALNLNPDDIFGRLGLTSLYALMGRMEDAKYEAKEVMRLHPDFSLESFAGTVTLKCQSAVIEVMETLRKAGLK